MPMIKITLILVLLPLIACLPPLSGGLPNDQQDAVYVAPDMAHDIPDMLTTDLTLPDQLPPNDAQPDIVVTAPTDMQECLPPGRAIGRGCMRNADCCCGPCINPQCLNYMCASL